ncbi:alpha/beta hydrolase [uncultured Proteiniphilum sp.]|uniref:alpha/beta hydrolase family protein n=1 Tax=uncultured Proteiniphilum sp. TaxID=497637 RepID=UPI002610867A|nr:alpha/beta hydrolase [uncultured Proteiniphilum sp.]
MNRPKVLLFILLGCILSSYQKGLSIGVVSVNPNKCLESRNDTILKIVLEGEDCPFANRAEYGVYIPEVSGPLQGVLILQHGCTMEQFGITRPYDLQYQAFAEKWKLAILETALYGDCHVWNEPNSGSATAVFKVLEQIAIQTGHPELKTAPWLLWGHSAGGYWALAMLRDHPERILAIVSYSAARNPQWDYTADAAKVPLLLRHAGANDGSPEILCWATALNTFHKLREMDAPVTIAYNEGQNHNFSYLRYMAIPFFEATLKQRLPNDHSLDLQDLDPNHTWLGDTLSLEIYKESDYSGDKSSMCVFPDESTARNWQEFVSTGTVVDKTPPPSPYNIRVKRNETMLEVTWEADADMESGILKFNIYKDDILIGTLPETGAYQSFDTNGDNTIPVKVLDMKFVITGTRNVKTKISVETVNHFNLVSERATITAR